MLFDGSLNEKDEEEQTGKHNVSEEKRNAKFAEDIPDNDTHYRTLSRMSWKGQEQVQEWDDVSVSQQSEQFFSGTIANAKIFRHNGRELFYCLCSFS